MTIREMSCVETQRVGAGDLGIDWAGCGIGIAAVVETGGVSPSTWGAMGLACYIAIDNSYEWATAEVEQGVKDLAMEQIMDSFENAPLDTSFYDVDPNLDSTAFNFHFDMPDLDLSFDFSFDFNIDIDISFDMPYYDFSDWGGGGPDDGC